NLAKTPYKIINIGSQPKDKSKSEPFKLTITNDGKVTFSTSVANTLPSEALKNFNFLSMYPNVINKIIIMKFSVVLALLSYNSHLYMLTWFSFYRHFLFEFLFNYTKINLVMFYYFMKFNINYTCYVIWFSFNLIP